MLAPALGLESEHRILQFRAEITQEAAKSLHFNALDLVMAIVLLLDRLVEVLHVRENCYSLHVAPPNRNFQLTGSVERLQSMVGRLQVAAQRRVGIELTS